MKKWAIFASSIALLILAIILIIKISEKDSLTGYATSDNIGLNITILYPAPILEIVKPTNGTYLSNNNLILSFTSSYASSIWYNLDAGSNTTISSWVYFNTTAGSHTLFLYANNSNSTTTKNVTFFVNTSKFYIIDDEYETEEDSDEDQGNMTRHQKKGQSTDFLNYSYEELQNLGNITLDNVNNGKISFNEAINLTNDSTPNDGYLDLNTYTNISFNRIELNSIALPNFNKSATLAIYGLTFTDPRILKDGSVCPSAICTKNSYSGGTLSFNVTGFSVYSTEETPSSSGTGQATGSGGGGDGITYGPTKDFVLDKKEIKVSLKQGQIKSEKIKIKNIKNREIKIKVSSQIIDQIVIINEREFILKPEEEKEITIDFAARENTVPELYIGKIIVESESEKEEIPTAIEIESDSHLFDVEMKVPTQFSIVSPGDEIVLNVRVFDVADTNKKVDVNIEYRIVSIYGEIIASTTESLAVEGQANYIKLLKLPKGMEGGQYIVYIKVDYEGKSASSSFLFIVRTEKKSGFNNSSLVPIILALLVLIIVVLLVLSVIIKRQHSSLKKVLGPYAKKDDEEAKNRKTRKIKAKLEVLEKAYMKGYISKDSYEKDKNRLKKTLNE